MVATLSFSFAATFTLSHCPTARKWKLSMLTIGSGLIVFCCGRRCDGISELIDIVDRRRHFGKATESKWLFMHTTQWLNSLHRNEKQKEELKRGKRCDGNDAGHASLRPPNDLCARPLFLTLIEAALLPQLVSILFAWVMGIRVDTVPNRDCGMLAGCGVDGSFSIRSTSTFLSSSQTGQKPSRNRADGTRTYDR
ncbi:hypothetical protein BLNAU_8054 [Blattamonas nauphoetae]|uniref:Uncharacterized protein n=1 Tax=Blattamonas nauphoetae TaxID=2049346 RepID=A0ABQ9XZW4_9EUKA|nr:hypothetical protein BLNAU_8054 [Blattamonas nauphoetae]